MFNLKESGIEPKLASGKEWKDMIRVDLNPNQFASELLSFYPKIPNIDEINDRFKLSRWPFVEGLNT